MNRELENDFIEVTQIAHKQIQDGSYRIVMMGSSDFPYDGTHSVKVVRGSNSGGGPDTPTAFGFNLPNVADTITYATSSRLAISTISDSTIEYHFHFFDVTPNDATGNYTIQMHQQQDGKIMSNSIGAFFSEDEAQIDTSDLATRSQVNTQTTDIISSITQTQIREGYHRYIVGTANQEKTKNDSTIYGDPDDLFFPEGVAVLYQNFYFDSVGNATPKQMLAADYIVNTSQRTALTPLEADTPIEAVTTHDLGGLIDLVTPWIDQ